VGWGATVVSGLFPIVLLALGIMYGTRWAWTRITGLRSVHRAAPFVYAFFCLTMGALCVAYPFLNPTPEEKDLRPISSPVTKYWFHSGSGFDSSTEIVLELQNGVELGTHALASSRVSDLLGGPPETTLMS